MGTCSGSIGEAGAWPSENGFKQVCLPILAPSSPPHSPSARGALHARLSHALLRAAQVAMMALLEAREHLAHPLAQLELFYDRIRGFAAALAGAGAPWRVCRDRSVSACRRPGAFRRRFCAYGPANAYVYDC